MIINLGRSHDAHAFEWSEISSIYLKNPNVWFPLNGYVVAGMGILHGPFFGGVIFNIYIYSSCFLSE